MYLALIFSSSSWQENKAHGKIWQYGIHLINGFKDRRQLSSKSREVWKREREREKMSNSTSKTILVDRPSALLFGNSITQWGEIYLPATKKEKDTVAPVRNSRFHSRTSLQYKVNLMLNGYSTLIEAICTLTQLLNDRMDLSSKKSILETVRSVNRGYNGYNSRWAVCIPIVCSRRTNMSLWRYSLEPTTRHKEQNRSSRYLWKNTNEIFVILLLEQQDKARRDRTTSRRQKKMARQIERECRCFCKCCDGGCGRFGLRFHQLVRNYEQDA